VHDSAAALWGDLQLLGIESETTNKGNVTHSPAPAPSIGIPAAIRRLANRVLMKHRSSDMCDLFTGRTADSRRLVVDNMITHAGILYPANTVNPAEIGSSCVHEDRLVACV